MSSVFHVLLVLTVSGMVFATELTYVRMEDGRLTERHTVPVDFDMENASEGLKQIVEDYQLPEVLGVPSP